MFPHIIIKPLSHRPSGMIYSYFCSSFALPFVLISLFLAAYFNWKPSPSISFEGSPFDHTTRFYMASLAAQKVKHLPTMWEAQQWHPTPVLLPGKSHGWRSVVGYSPWGRKESDMTEQLHFHVSIVQMILYAISIN